MDSLEAIILIENASQAVLFGADPKGAYRRLAQLCHPDKAPEKLKTRAERAFAKLDGLYRGLTAPLAIQIGDWKIKGPLAKGDICDVYLTNPDAVLKIARATNDNDLMEAEGRALKHLDASRSFVGHKNYIPRLIETFKASGRRANVTTLAKGCYSLIDIMALYPGGLDFRHCVWMMNRGLSAIGFAHQNGICHGAILPQHLLYEPHGHGLQLVYDLALYFAARHTAHDNWDKRQRKGYLFLIGDEHAYPAGVEARQVRDVIGDKLQGDIPLKDIITECQQRYHVFFIIPNLTSYYSDRELEKYWVKLLGQQNVLKLEDPEKICECIVSAVAICEENVGLDELAKDGISAGLEGALVPLAKAAGELSKYSAAGLPAVAGDSAGTERL